MSYTNAFENEVLEVLRAWVLEISLHTGDPGEDGNLNELVGQSYVRKAIAFNAAAGGQMVNTALVRWDDLPAATLTHFVIHRTGVGPKVVGTLVGPDPPNPPEVLLGQSFEIPAGTLAVSQE